MTQIGYFTPPPLPFVNRSTTLMVIGILFVIAGALCGCMAALTPLMMMARVVTPQGAAPANAISPGQIMIALAFYILLSALLITLGIGAIRKRRWFRPIVLSISWIVLAGGIFGISTLIFRAPDITAGMRAQMTAQPGVPAPPPALVHIMLAVMLLVALAMYLVLPGLLVWFLRGEDVRATLEYFDPKPRWTDRIPLPAMIVFVLLALAALGPLMMIWQGWTPLFGKVIYGPPAIIVSAVMSLLFATTAYFALRLRPIAPWMGIALWLMVMSSWIVTVLSNDMRAVYQRAGMSSQQLEMANRMHTYPDATMAAHTALALVMVIGFTLWARRHFGKPRVE